MYVLLYYTKLRAGVLSTLYQRDRSSLLDLRSITCIYYRFFVFVSDLFPPSALAAIPDRKM
jgi:hypothetical protein